MDPQAAQPANQRIPFSLAYLLAVVAGGVLNSAIFAFLAHRLLSPTLDLTLLVAVSAFFGMLFAGGSNLSAQTLARWFNRRSVTDRILFFLLVTLAGDVLLIFALPHVARQFQ